MNAYYENTGYRVGTIGTRKATKSAFGDKFISFICTLVAMVTCPVAVKLEKVAAATALLFLLFGVVGGIEAETISMGLGIIICFGISFVEYLIFKSIDKKDAK